MGISIKKQIANHIYPDQDAFFNYYITQAHSIHETAEYFKISKDTVINLINYFNIHKSTQQSYKLCVQHRINKRHYPLKDELISMYQKYGTWESVRQYFGIPEATFKRLRYRYGLKNTVDKVFLIKESLKEFIQSYDHKPTGNEIASDLNVNLSQVYYWVEKHGLNYLLNQYGSAYENELRSLLNKYDFKKDRTVLAPYELDFFSPSLNLAIEFNGDYWHSNKFKTNDYHFKKSKQCDTSHIRLIHIYEYDFINKRNEIIQYIQNFLITPIDVCCDPQKYKVYTSGSSDTSITISVRDLCNNTDINSTVFVRCDNHGHWKINEYHPDLNYHFHGSFPLIFEYFITHFHPTIINCVCDYSIDNGIDLLNCGMQFIKFQQPDPMLFDEHVVYNAGYKLFQYKVGNLYD